MMSLKNKMLQIWDEMARSSSGLQDKGCMKGWSHFRLENMFLEDKTRCLSMMHNLSGSKPLQDTQSRRLHQRCPSKSLRDKDCMLVAARSSTIQLGM
jgi:hypothetical protein